MSRFRIRVATAADVDALARVHVTAWRETYRGIMPDAVLDGMSVAQRAEMWKQLLDGAPERPRTLVGEAADEIVGFASGGAARDAQLGTDGEIIAINLVNAAKRRGIGRALFEGTRAGLTERGFRAHGLWVVESNAPARAFYESLGGRLGTSRAIKIGGADLTEVAYLWGSGS